MNTKARIILIALTSIFSLPGFGQYTILHNFNDSLGANPYGDLILSGTTLYGTANHGGVHGEGVVFSIQTNGSGYTDLHNFNDTLGELPHGSLLLLGDTLYGTTQFGGTYNDGVVFSMETSGSGYTDIYNFCYNATCGDDPLGSLVISDSILYGTTWASYPSNDGSLFSVKINGNAGPLFHNFNLLLGSNPGGSLTLSGDTLFGMAFNGDPFGVIYSIQTNGVNFRVLHSFSSWPDGVHPYGSLTLSPSGDTLYGMTFTGGSSSYYGVIFSMQTNGNGYTVLHNFNESAGGWPTGSLILSGTTLYGMTDSGGAYNKGIIFSVQTNGSGYTDLYDFDGVHGEYPNGDLIISGDTLYGMTVGGGSEGYGVIFSYNLSTQLLGIKSGKAGSTTMNIFPNPANQTIDLVFGEAISSDAIFAITDLTGRVIGKANSHQPSPTSQTFDISELANGIYFVRVYSAQSQFIAKFIKQ